MSKILKFYVPERGRQPSQSDLFAEIIAPSDFNGMSIEEACDLLQLTFLERTPKEFHRALKLEAGDYDEGGSYIKAYWEREETEEDRRRDAEQLRVTREKEVADRLTREMAEYIRLKAKFEGKP